MPGESKTSPRRIKAVERQKQALELRKAGRSFQVIAEHIGYRGPSSAKYAVEAALNRVVGDSVREFRSVQLERLQTILTVLWPMMLTGNLKAIDRLLRVFDQINRIMGIYASVKVDLKMVEDEAQRLADERGLDVSVVMSELDNILARRG